MTDTLKHNLYYFVQDVKSITDMGCTQRHTNQIKTLMEKVNEETFEEIVVALCSVSYRIRPLVEPAIIELLDNEKYKNKKLPSSLVQHIIYFSYDTFIKLYERIDATNSDIILALVKFYCWRIKFPEYNYCLQAICFLEQKKYFPEQEDKKELMANNLSENEIQLLLQWYMYI
jgi:hypothetical protein